MPVLLDPAARPVIGHRGAAALAPENTIISFERAVADGADAIEFDVHVSADGHVVVIHDPTLDRTTDGTGAVAELTLERIRAADAGARFTRDGMEHPYRGRGVRVPTLTEVLDRFPALPMLIEIKTVRARSGAPCTSGSWTIRARHGACGTSAWRGSSATIPPRSSAARRRLQAQRRVEPAHERRQRDEILRDA